MPYNGLIQELSDEIQECNAECSVPPTAEELVHWWHNTEKVGSLEASRLICALVGSYKQDRTLRQTVDLLRGHQIIDGGEDQVVVVYVPRDVSEDTCLRILSFLAANIPNITGRVVLVSEDVQIETLDEESLKRCGLQRIPNHGKGKSS